MRPWMVAVALAAAACGGGSPTAPTLVQATPPAASSGLPASLAGTFQTFISREDTDAASAIEGVNLTGDAGTWQLVMTPAGRYSVRQIEKGITYEEGTVSAEGARLMFRVDTLRSATCAGNFPVGSVQTYEYRLEGNTLRLTTVSSGCIDDTLVLTRHPLNRIG